jgi:hypothetical protein
MERLAHALWEASRVWRPASGETYEWLTSYAEQDFRTGAYESESIHFCRSNPPRLAKYWRKAMEAAGILKSNR